MAIRSLADGTHGESLKAKKDDSAAEMHETGASENEVGREGGMSAQHASRPHNITGSEEFEKRWICLGNQDLHCLAAHCVKHGPFDGLDRECDKKKYCWWTEGGTLLADHRWTERRTAE